MPDDDGIWSRRFRLPAAVLVLVLLSMTGGGCNREPEWTLERAGQRLFEVRSLPLGDIVGLQFGPFTQADWFVVYPAMADSATFSTISRLAEHEAALKELAGSDAPGMALIKDDRVIEDWPLPAPYATRKVHARPADAVNGIRFARHAEPGRNVIILGVD